MISERVLITAIICTAALIALIIAGLVFIAITHDGTNESAIVTAMIALPTLLITAGSTLFGHWLGGKNASNGNAAP